MGNVWDWVDTNFSVSIELSRRGCSNLRSLSQTLISLWRMYLDMWSPSGLVEVLKNAVVVIFREHGLLE